MAMEKPKFRDNFTSKMQSIKKFLTSDKKRAGIIISLIVITGGLIPLLIFTFSPDIENTYRLEEKTLVSKDSTKLQARIYYPESSYKNDLGIVVAHGYCGNKQYMQPLCIELVKRGFTVISIDFRGHGSSDGHLLPRDHKNRYNRLVEDMEVAIRYLKASGKIDKVGLVGHSMGGRTALEVAEDNPNKIDATVAIGMLSTDFNFSRISNLLLAIGEYEQLFTKQQALEMLEKYTGKKNVKIGVRYGDFDDGDACKVVVGPYSEHLAEVLDSKIVYETVKWFEYALAGEEGKNIRLTIIYNQISFLITLVGVIALIFVLIMYISNYIFKNKIEYPEKNLLQDISILKLLMFYIMSFAIAIIFQSIFAGIFTDILPISSINSLFAIVMGTAIGIFAVYYLFILRRKEHLSIKDFPSKLKVMSSPNCLTTIIYGILIALLSISSIAAVAHWSSTTSIPTAREVGTIISITILFFPFIMIKEFYFRMIQGHLNISQKIKEYFAMLGIGILMDNVLLVPIMIYYWKNPNHELAFLALSLTVLMIFSIIMQTLVTWVYMHSGRNILGSTTFLCIFYAWMIINFFPFGTN